MLSEVWSLESGDWCHLFQTFALTPIVKNSAIILINKAFPYICNCK